MLSNKFISEISMPKEFLDDETIQNAITTFNWSIYSSTVNNWCTLKKALVYNS